MCAHYFLRLLLFFLTIKKIAYWQYNDKTVVAFLGGSGRVLDGAQKREGAERVGATLSPRHEGYAGLSGFSILAPLTYSISTPSLLRSTSAHVHCPRSGRTALPVQAEAEALACVHLGGREDRHGVWRGVMWPHTHTRASLFVTVSTLGKIVHHFRDFNNLSSY